MRLKSFIFGLAIVLSHQASIASMPQCARPLNFSDNGVLKKFETCLGSQTQYCDAHSKDPECVTYSKNKHPKRPNEKSISDNCAVQANGFYRCKPGTVKFIEKDDIPIPNIPKLDSTEDQPNLSPSSSGASTTPTPTPSISVAPTLSPSMPLPPPGLLTAPPLAPGPGR